MERMDPGFELARPGVDEGDVIRHQRLTALSGRAFDQCRYTDDGNKSRQFAIEHREARVRVLFNRSRAYPRRMA